MLETLNAIDSFVWGPPLLVLLIGTGLLLTVRLHLLQVFRLPRALKLIFTAKNQGEGDVDSFKALCTALAATVGTGNIVGVATAVHAGGPGAIFWMWMAAFVGMATKYAEGCLAVKYRTVDKNGDIAGGPMYYIENGLGKKYKPLAFLFAFFGVLVAFFGIGTFAQVNSIVEITRLTTSIPVEYTAIVLTILVAAITIGGLQSIARVASKIVPAMAVIYVVSTVAFLVVFADQIPAAVEQIIVSAFTPTAAAGGFLGATVLVAMRNGVARGVFSNESGLGSAPIVAAAAKTKWPAEQGLISMTGTFIDTIIICTLTGLVLVVSGAWMGDVNGAALTNAAFKTLWKGISHDRAETPRQNLFLGLRQRGSAEGCESDYRGRRDLRHYRPVRSGQIDACALHQPARAPDLRRGLGRRSESDDAQPEGTSAGSPSDRYDLPKLQFA